eukprot:4206150-Prymnesium_polylepis.1
MRSRRQCQGQQRRTRTQNKRKRKARAAVARQPSTSRRVTLSPKQHANKQKCRTEAEAASMRQRHI